MSVIRVFAKKHETHTLTNPTICPVCGGKGYGVHPRWAKEPQYGPYSYFAHPNGHRGDLKWCYLGREVTEIEAPESICLNCPILDTCNPSSTFAACYINQSEDSTGPKKESPPDFLRGVPKSTSSTTYGTLGPLNPSPRDKQCAKCGANYPETTERRCTCGGFLLLSTNNRYS